MDVVRDGTSSSVQFISGFNIVLIGGSFLGIYDLKLVILQINYREIDSLNLASGTRMYDPSRKNGLFIIQILSLSD